MNNYFRIIVIIVVLIGCLYSCVPFPEEKTDLKFNFDIYIDYPNVDYIIVDYDIYTLSDTHYTDEEILDNDGHFHLKFNCIYSSATVKINMDAYNDGDDLLESQNYEFLLSSDDPVEAVVYYYIDPSLW